MKINWKEVQKVKCHFCEATIEAAPDIMVGGRRRYDSKPGRIPNWMKEKPGFYWYANGIGDQVFFLCPDHSGDEYIKKAFGWARRGERGHACQT